MLVNVGVRFSSVRGFKETTLLGGEQPGIPIADFLRRVEQEENRHAVASLQRRWGRMGDPRLAVVFALEDATFLAVRSWRMEGNQDILEIGRIDFERI